MLNSAKSTPFALAAYLVPALPVQHPLLLADTGIRMSARERWHNQASTTCVQGLVSSIF
jgi:hypothetical protein